MGTENYFRYFASAGARTGPHVTGCGRTVIGPGAAYPPPGHPGARAFDWEHGRVLPCLQLIAITRGRGVFETRALKATKVEAGAWILLLPGEWHRYRPDAKTGWTEHWLELEGFDVSGLAGRAARKHSDVLAEPADSPELILLFERLHRLARAEGEQWLIHSLGNHLVESGLRARAEAAITSRERAAREAVAARRAESWLVERMEQAVSIEALASEVGLHPGSLRRAFKRKTGLSPKQYHLGLRLARAREWVADGRHTLAEIAERLGFDSAFHLSAQFKRRFGASPAKWREQMGRESGGT